MMVILVRESGDGLSDGRHALWVDCHAWLDRFWVVSLIFRVVVDGGDCLLLF